MSVNSKHARVEIVVDGTDIMVIKAEMKRLKAENKKLKQEMSAERKVFEDMNSQGWLQIATADEERTTLKAENERLNAMVVHLLEKKVVDLCGRVAVMEMMKQEADTELPTFSPQGADDDS